MNRHARPAGHLPIHGLAKLTLPSPRQYAEYVDESPADAGGYSPGRAMLCRRRAARSIERWPAGRAQLCGNRSLAVLFYALAGWSRL